MFRQLRQNRLNSFTLAEMIVVMVVVGAVAGFALPKLHIALERFRSKEGVQILLAVWGSQKRYSLDNAGSYTSSLASLDVELRFGQYFNTDALALTNGTGVFTASLPKRTDRPPAYTFSINSGGVITCSGSTWCSRMGY